MGDQNLNYNRIKANQHIFHIVQINVETSTNIVEYAMMSKLRSTLWADESLRIKRVYQTMVNRQWSVFVCFSDKRYSFVNI